MSRDTENLDPTAVDERLRAAAAVLVEAEVLPGPTPLPDFGALFARRARWRRMGVLAVSGAVMASAVVFGLSLAHRAPISYVVDGAVVIDEGTVAAAAMGSAARLRFSEGTEVGLDPSARLRVIDRSDRGADLALVRGKARFDVMHRSGARWSVAAGPFTIDVTGTRFSADWTPSSGKLTVELRDGHVRVHGAALASPLELNAGERLVATVSDGHVTLSPIVPDTGKAAGPRAEKTDAPAGTAGTAGTGGGEARARARASASARASTAGGEADRRPLLAMLSPDRKTRPEKLDLPKRHNLVVPAAPAERSEMQPPPVMAPAAPSAVMGGGGVFCTSDHAQYNFEGQQGGLSVFESYTTAFKWARVDRTHSWCGLGSGRADMAFDRDGRRNFFGRYLNEAGQFVIRLPHNANFTNKTVTMHFYVDGPRNARFTAELFVVHRGAWVGSPASENLTAGRWWTITHRFDADNPVGHEKTIEPRPYPSIGRSPVFDCNRIALSIRSTGPLEKWTGSVYVDDVGWR